VSELLGHTFLGEGPAGLDFISTKPQFTAIFRMQSGVRHN